MDQFTLAWLQDLGIRAWRQAEQTAVPVLTQVVTSGGAIDIKAAGAALVGVEAVTLLKFLAATLLGVQFRESDPLWKRLLERALPAAAGVYAGLGIASYRDLITVDWGHVSWAALAAAVIALAATKVSPAPSPVDQVLAA